MISYVAQGVKETPNYLVVKDSDGTKVKSKLDAIGQYQVLPFDLSLVNSSGKPITFDTCTLTLPLDDRMNLENGKVAVVSVREDGTLEAFDNAEVVIVNNKNCVRFTTTHFSEYDILYLENAASGTESTDPQGTGVEITASLEGGESPVTSALTGYIVSGGVMSGNMPFKFSLDSPVSSVTGSDVSAGSGSGTPQADNTDPFTQAAAVADRPANTVPGTYASSDESSAVRPLSDSAFRSHLASDGIPATHPASGDTSDLKPAGKHISGKAAIHLQHLPNYVIALILFISGVILLVQTIPAGTRTKARR